MAQTTNVDADEMNFYSDMAVDKSGKRLKSNEDKKYAKSVMLPFDRDREEDTISIALTGEREKER